MEWISVKDKLPKYGETVILVEHHDLGKKKYRISAEVGERTHTNDNGDNFMVYQCYSAGRKMTDFQNVFGITHWMPLPEPPKTK